MSPVKSRPLNIALVSPLYESVPPKLYGGTERVIHWLAEALIDLGHDVTIYASGDSQTRARVIPAREQALRLGGGRRDDFAAHVNQMEQVIFDSDLFDIIHFHTEMLHFGALRRINVPTISTFHGRLDCADTQRVLAAFPEARLVSISNAQRPAYPGIQWQSTVYHGMPRDSIEYHSRGQGYLAFLGRISPEKRVDRAIEIARLAGKKIKIAAKIDPQFDGDYPKTVQHLFEQPHVEFVGEITDDQKSEFLGNADALLFPIDWPEPFGLVMIEALAAGTPIIAWNCGSVPEIVRHGKNGFVIQSLREGVEAVERLPEISRQACRQDFETRFTSERMARDYLRAYQTVRIGELLHDA